jgi:peptide/nickel transport system permease protein
MGLRRRLLGHPGFLIGALLLLAALFLASFAGSLSPHDPLDQDLSRRLIPPVWEDGARASWIHPLGTDQLGRDYLSRLMHGARVSLLVGFATVLIAGVIGTFLGVVAGYFGGRVDLAVNFIVTTRLSLPVVLVALAVVSLFGSSLAVVIAVLGCLLWDRFAVVLRSATQQIRSQEYITAARAIGCSTPRILLTEVAPNILGPLVVVATLEVAHAILLESALSFLGLGVQPPTPSWGLMVAEARGLMFYDPWLIALPGGALFLLVLAINLSGDGLRDLMAHQTRAIPDV